MSSSFINKNKGKQLNYKNIKVNETYVVEMVYEDPFNGYTPGDHIQKVLHIYKNNNGTITGFKTDKGFTLPANPEKTKFYERIRLAPKNEAQKKFTLKRTQRYNNLVALKRKEIITKRNKNKRKSIMNYLAAQVANTHIK